MGRPWSRLERDRGNYDAGRIAEQNEPQMTQMAQISPFFCGSGESICVICVICGSIHTAL